MDRYEVKRKIGQGSFGNVYLTIHRKTRRSVVLKEVKVSRMNTKERQDVAKEVDLLSKLSHPNIIQYVDSFSDNIGYVSIRSYYIVMEYCDGGDLYTKINKQRGRLLPENVILTYFVQICRAVQYIHERKILHRDIKTQNIFLAGHSRGIKLGDFGIAKIMDGTTEYAKTCIGTPYYLSPEIWEKKPYSNKSDIWALGCVLYELTTLKHAFETGCLKNLMLKILKGSYPQIPNKYSYETRQLIDALLRKKPEDRPSLNMILRREFLQKVEKELHQPKSQQHSHNIRTTQTKRAKNVYISKNSRRRNSEFRDIEITHDNKKSSYLKRQNPFIQLLTEGKKLREQKPLEFTEEEYLQKLKEIQMLNANERKYLYEKYGRARSSLAKFDNPKLDNKRQKSGGASHPMSLWFDLSDILNTSSGRRTANSDTFVMNDLNMNKTVKANVGSDDEENDDDKDVTIIPLRKSEPFNMYRPDKNTVGRMYRRRSSGMLDTLRNFMCLGSDQNSIVFECNTTDTVSEKTEETVMSVSAESQTSPQRSEDTTDSTEDDSEGCPKTLTPIHEEMEIPSPVQFINDCDTKKSEEDYFKYLWRSFSLPNLTFTPLESLIPNTEDLKVKSSFDYSDDFELESVNANDDNDDFWHETLDPIQHSDIFAFLESQRAVLEEKIGTGTLLKVYKMINRLDKNESERIDYADLIKILGKGNEELIDDIIQLVVADQFFH